MDEQFGQVLSVLLIDDDPIDLEIFRQRLTDSVGLRYQVFAAVNLQQAQGLLKDQTIDLCLLDFSLDSVRGVDVLPSLRAAGLAGPVMMLTGQDDEATELACLAAGVDGFIPKRLAEGRSLDRALRFAWSQFQDRQRLTRVGSLDPIAEVFHRHVFLDRLSRALQCKASTDKPGQVCVAYFGICGFKQVNARHGREVGDQVLRICAQRLNRRFGPGTVLGRVVGDEFAICLPNARRSSFSTLAKKALEDIAVPIVIAGRRVEVEMSAGIATYPYDAVTAELLLERAELAMRAARESGEPNRLQLFELGQLSRLQYPEHLERELRSGIERDRLSIVFEPIVRIADRRLVGVEVLSRWQYRSDEWISPGDFIPLAERSDLILSLTDSVLEKTATCLEAWLRAGLIDNRFRASVNIPAKMLGVRDAEHRLLGPFRRHNLPATMLGLELTERGLFEMEADTRELLERLRAAGTSLIIDDFGTGFSSLSYLCDLPVDQIKIDRSFLVAAQSNPRGLLIVRSIAALGASLGIKVLAEGVETEDMLELVAREGAELMQGYLNGRAESPLDFRRRLQQQVEPD